MRTNIVHREHHENRHFFRPQQLLRERNVLTSVCHSFCPLGGRGSASKGEGSASEDWADTPSPSDTTGYGQ